MNVCSMTDIGVKREMNQDYLFCSEEPVGNLPNLFLVADGMGGHRAGEFASRFAVETIVDTVQKNTSTDIPEILSEGIRAANELLLKRAQSDDALRGMGTTIVAAAVRDGCLTVANVGDSRLYLIGEEVRQITEDHSLVQEMVRMGELDREAAKHHPDKNIITRAVGVEKSVGVDLFETDLRRGQKILLCSDGLSNMVEEHDLQRILCGEGDLCKKTEKLINLANKNGGKDNITVIIIEPNADEVKTC